MCGQGRKGIRKERGSEGKRGRAKEKKREGKRDKAGLGGKRALTAKRSDTWRPSVARFEACLQCMNYYNTDASSLSQPRPRGH